MTASYRDQGIGSLRVLDGQNCDLGLYLLRFLSLSCMAYFLFSGVPEAQASCSGYGDQAALEIFPRAEQPLNLAVRGLGQRGAGKKLSALGDSRLPSHLQHPKRIVFLTSSLTYKVPCQG